MGKKTNWTLVEDLALCRAWLHASESPQLQAPEQRASTFWATVHQLFHAEMTTTVERPVNGLKIRWTRINRDVQKFATIHSLALASASKSSEGGAAPLEDSLEAQALIDEAKAQFEKQWGAKFAFEACWKLVRYSPKWMLNLSNSTGISVPPPPRTEANTLMQERPVPVEEETPVALPAAAESFRAASALPASGLHKRRASSLLDSFSQEQAEPPLSPTGALVDELRRRNELLEEQNAIALFSLDADKIKHDDARACIGMLRQRYLKKMRLAMAMAEQAEVAGEPDALQMNPSARVGRARGDVAEDEEKSASPQMRIM